LDSTRELMDLTVCIVASYVSHNAVTPQELPELINNVYAMLSKLNPGRDAAQSQRVPAVPIGQSITRDYLVCLDDGRRLKTLKRYLRRKYCLTPDQYRARWGLPDDYPMVAPGYAELRSSLARRSTIQSGAAAMTKPVKNGPRKS
jgi:predicted transcriptional regulator